MKPRKKVVLLFFGLLILVPFLAYALPMGAQLCRDTLHYVCYKVKQGDTWQKLFPDSNELNEAMHVNRMNTELYPGIKLAIPKSGLDTPLLDLAPFPERINPLGRKLIYVSINPSVLAFGAYDSSGNLVAWGPAVGARGYCPDIHHGCHTPIGTFEIYRKEGPHCVSTKFPVGRGGAPMPWCMYFHGGMALHGSYEVPGYNASHGCVRMLVPDAEWLNQDFVGDENVMVIVTQQK